MNASRALPALVLAGVFPVLVSGQSARIPRPEHPRPQFYRDSWLNLNGPWNFAFDFQKAGLRENWQEQPERFDRKITVPICPESGLSGIGYTDFIPAVWYHRRFELPSSWKGKRIFLHFGGGRLRDPGLGERPGGRPALWRSRLL